MTKITVDARREIIDDFAQEIFERKKLPRKPDKGVINFRNEQKDGYQREIWEVPIALLRYRKDNGRITSDVLSYEKIHGILKEDTDEAQKKIAEFLDKKDPEKTDDLYQSIKHAGQEQPAIITADGFLINGNRRKLVLDKLDADPKNGDTFKFMRVIILPGKLDQGGPPTLKEIEQIENRYQLQKDGKAEYYKFDRALSIRMKRKKGMSLEEQLRDDSTYAGLETRAFQKAVKEYENEYLKPLECIDRYLEYFDRPRLYDTISTGQSDRAGRWQAFFDYSKFYEQLKDGKKRNALGIKDTDVGKIEDIVFKIIRKREISTSENGNSTGLPKVHKVMRELSKFFRERVDGRENDAKKELFKLLSIEKDLSDNDKHDKNGEELPPRDVDYVWGKKHAELIIRQLKKAYHLVEHEKDSAAPINHLRHAFEELDHDDLQDPSDIGIDYLDEAARLSRDIKNKADELENQFYRYKKNLKDLTGKK